MPYLPILGNIFKVRVLRKGKRGSLCAPARYARETIGTVADHRKVVRNRLRLHSELRDHARFIAQELAPAVQLDYPRSHNTLAEILVGRANQYPLNALIQRGFGGS